MRQKYVNVRDPRNGESYATSFKELGDLISDLQAADVGQKFEIQVIEMTEEEFEALPEFEGQPVVVPA